jgi:TrmH family RNA methyltransferase
MTDRLKRITSLDNPFYKELKKLASSSQARKRAGLSFLDGIHLCQAYRDQRGSPRYAIVRDDRLEHGEIASLIDGLPEVTVLPASMLNEIEGTESGQGVIYVVETPRVVLPKEINTTTVLLDRVQDPGNVGAILRTCAAAGVARVFLGKGSAIAWSPKVLRAGMGAHFAVEVFDDCDLYAVCERLTIPLIATSSHAEQSLWKSEWSGECAWLFGHEGQGADEELLARANVTVNIPLARNTESLNVAAAVAVCLFEQRRRAAG